MANRCAKFRLREPPLTREFVEDQRRHQVVVAVAELAHEVGIAAVTAVDVCAKVRMARATYYSLFGSSAGCLRYAFAEAFEQLFDPVRRAGESSESWLAGLNDATGTLLDRVAMEPLLAELCLVHSMGVPEEAHGHDYQAAVETMIGVLARGRDDVPTSPGQSELIEEYLARMIVSLVALRVRGGETSTLPDHREELVMLVVVSFYGPGEAQRFREELNGLD